VNRRMLLSPSNGWSGSFLQNRGRADRLLHRQRRAFALRFGSTRSEPAAGLKMLS